MRQILYRLFEHQYLGREEARDILHNLVEGRYNDAQIASLITVFLMRSISVEELAGFREALLEMRVPINLEDYHPIDIVGTGGDGKNTFNISTCACFVVAAAGYPVVKHGNYGATSVSGASNVMERHGVCFTTDVDRLRRSIDECGIAYLHAPLFNPSGRLSTRRFPPTNCLVSITCPCLGSIIIPIRRVGPDLRLRIASMAMTRSH